MKSINDKLFVLIILLFTSTAIASDIPKINTLAPKSDLEIKNIERVRSVDDSRLFSKDRFLVGTRLWDEFKKMNNGYAPEFIYLKGNHEEMMKQFHQQIATKGAGADTLICLYIEYDTTTDDRTYPTCGKEPMIWHLVVVDRAEDIRAKISKILEADIKFHEYYFTMHFGEHKQKELVHFYMVNLGKAIKPEPYELRGRKLMREIYVNIARILEINFPNNIISAHTSNPEAMYGFFRRCGFNPVPGISDPQIMGEVKKFEIIDVDEFNILFGKIPGIEKAPTGKLANVISVNPKNSVAIINDSGGKVYTFFLKPKGTLNFTAAKKAILSIKKLTKDNRELVSSILNIAERSPPDVQIFYALIDDLFGFTSPDPQHNLIVLHNLFKQDPLAVFYLIGELLFKRGDIYIDAKGPFLLIKDKNGNILKNAQGKEIGKIMITTKDAKRLLAKADLKPEYQQMYRFRAMTRQMFKKEGTKLVRRIKNIRGLRYQNEIENIKVADKYADEFSKNITFPFLLPRDRWIAINMLESPRPQPPETIIPLLESGDHIVNEAGMALVRRSRRLREFDNKFADHIAQVLDRIEPEKKEPVVQDTNNWAGEYAAFYDWEFDVDQVMGSDTSEEDANENVLGEAIEPFLTLVFLADNGNIKAMELIEKKMATENDKIRSALTFALGQINSDWAVDVLTKLFDKQAEKGYASDIYLVNFLARTAKGREHVNKFLRENPKYELSVNGALKMIIARDRVTDVSSKILTETSGILVEGGAPYFLTRQLSAFATSYRKELKEKLYEIQEISDTLAKEFGPRYIGVSIVGSLPRGYFIPGCDLDFYIIADPSKVKFASAGKSMLWRFKELCRSKGIIHEDRLVAYIDIENDLGDVNKVNPLFSGMFFGNRNELDNVQREAFNTLTPEQWNRLVHDICQCEQNLAIAFHRFCFPKQEEREQIRIIAGLTRTPPTYEEMRVIYRLDSPDMSGDITSQSATENSL